MASCHEKWDNQRVKNYYKLATALKGRLGHKTTQKLLARINELLDGDKIKNMPSASDEDASVGHKSHLAMTDERLISGIETTTGRSADTKITLTIAKKKTSNSYPD